MLPHDVAKLLVDGIDRTLTLDVHQAIDLGVDRLLSLVKLGSRRRHLRPKSLVSKIILDGVRQDKVAVGQALHERGSTQTVGTVVREVALTDGKEARDGGLQLIVDPDTGRSSSDYSTSRH